MSGISSTQSSTSRITGLYSQLDTDKIVKDLLNIQQTKVNAKSQEKTKQEWFGDALGEVRGLLNDFKNNFLSALGKDSMVVSAAYNNLKADITAGTDSAAVSITARTSAFTGNYSVDYIKELAKNASVSSTGKISADSKSISDSNTTKLGDLKFSNKLEFDQSGKVSFSINGERFSFDKNTTLQNMINTVNSNEKAGVTMKYSRLTDGFSIEADAGGAESRVAIANHTGNAFGENSAFGIGTGSTDQAGFGTMGNDAVLSIDGVEITRNSNTFAIDGIEYSLKAKTSVQPQDGKVDSPAIRFSVSRDVSSTIDKVKKFITAYNELTEKLNGKLSEKDMSKKYAPLTPEQEDELSESQIETWNTKAKTGLLRNNQDLRGFLQEVKNSFFSSLGGTDKTAASLGLSTGSRYTSDSGKIILNEEALTRALEENPDAVMNMFAGSGNGADGLMRKVTNRVNSYIKNLDNATKTSDKKLSGLEDKIKDMEDGLDKMAERYYEKFSIMEQAMGKLNSQMGMLSSLLSS